MEPVWEAHRGSLRPLLPGDDLRPGREQLWVRRNSSSPWVLDVLLTPTDGDQWLYKRDHGIRRPLDEAGFPGADGVSYLAPEIVLLYKAKLARPKDRDDFAAMLPRLDDAARSWLVQALQLAQPGHAWLAALDEPG